MLIKMTEKCMFPQPPPPPLSLNLIESSCSFLPKPCKKDCCEPEKLIQMECDRKNSSLLYYTYSKLNPFLQTGPSCGMAALAMAIGNEDKVFKQLCNIAIERGWSKQGEMFSCDWMLQLAQLIDCNRAVIISGGISNHIECICACLQDGGRILVPYDKTQNHSPGLRNGKSAHWAVISGFAVLGNTCMLNKSKKTKACSCLGTNRDSNNFLGIKNEEFVMEWADDSLYVGSTPVEISVFAYQGLSSHVKLWPFSDLAESNENLVEIDPKRIESVVAPDGGIREGLCGQALLLFPTK